MSAAAVQFLLQYLYTGSLEFSTLTPPQLQQVLVLADRWLLPQVAVYCRQYILTGLYARNALAWLLWADAQQEAAYAQEIRQEAKTLVSVHYREVFEKEGGQEEVVQLFARPELAMEVTAQAVKKL